MTENKGQQDRPALGKRGDGNNDSSGRRRKSKRRYFRRKRQDAQARSDQPSGANAGAQKSQTGQEPASQPRKSRRRRGGRRSSRRPYNEAVETPEQPEILPREEESYTEPVEVYIYTYVVRPNY